MLKKMGKFKNIPQQMIKIYLDWNVLTTLNQIQNIENHAEKIIFETILNIVSNTETKIVVPFSNAHLNDLMKSYKKGERERVSNALNFISFVTQNICLSQYWNEENSIWHFRNPNEYFESLIEDEKENSIISIESITEIFSKYGMGNIFEMYKLIPHNINFKQCEVSKIPFVSLLKKAKVENSIYAVMEDFFEITNEIKNNPSFYNELRSYFTSYIKLDPNVNNVENVIELLDKTMPKTMLNKSFTELYIENNKIESSKNKDFSKITGMFMQLDFIGFSSDKLNEKNKYDNLFNDALHCFYGAHCDIFITSDKKMIKKTKALYKSLEINTLVLTPRQFIESLKQIE
jgi:hypothetical protein